MNNLQGSEILNFLKWRYATKAFDPQKKISEDAWKVLEQSLVLTPSSFGLQPWKFFVVDNQQLRTQLREFSWGQSQITDASHLLVLAAKKDLGEQDIENLIDSIAKIRNVERSTLEGYRQMMLGFFKNPAPGFNVNVWAANQVYIALGNLLTVAAAMGIDACPMEGFDPGKYDELLGLSKKGYRSVVLATLGYRSSSDSYSSATKVRFSNKDLIEHI